ncbi:hypothetical protein Ani05nite_16700 [Amorphoplanes nipponensis]|uniref:Uncharacterized protein n=2 Tax=Actinoplanes nipponensis TaxID=135950 RepID=A0A919JFC1_9ACTN|nr:hypothetical protein Ani05nite_16700 [Actinoplanes nipponensis]
MRPGCNTVAPPPRTFRSGGGASDTQVMEPLASVSFAGGAGQRPAGWQMQLRVDYAVNKVMQTHRGQSEDAVAQAIQDELRTVGVVPNGRQIAQYAAVISSLPLLPPNNRT